MGCSDKYQAHFHGGNRVASNIRYVVLHSTEGSTAAGAASWFANPASRGSAHIVVDENECYRTVKDSVIAYAAPPLNEEGLQLEIAGFAASTKAAWLAPKSRKKLKRAARRTAHWCHEYNIPREWVHPGGLRQGKRGITLHRWVTAAFHVSTHTDPGQHFPKRWFMRQVRKAYREIAGRG